MSDTINPLPTKLTNMDETPVEAPVAETPVEEATPTAE